MSERYIDSMLSSGYDSHLGGPIPMYVQRTPGTYGADPRYKINITHTRRLLLSVRTKLHKSSSGQQRDEW